MGRDKAMIEFDGRPLWECQLERLRALEPRQLFVSARTKPDWLPLKVELLLDDLPSRGPLSGLTKALTAMRTTHLIVLAVDMPFMTTEQICGLSRLAMEGCGAVPMLGERAEPLAAIYPAEAAPDFADALAGADFSLQGIVRKLAADKKVLLIPVPAGHEQFYQSVNEPVDIKEGRFLNRPPT